MELLAVFRADAAPEIGGGHVQRCLAFGDVLLETGWDVAFAFRPGTLETVPALKSSPHLLLPIDGAVEEEPSVIAAALPGDSDLLVVDHYGRDRAFERACRSFASRIMAIEDQPGRRHDCDLLLDPTPGRRVADYRQLVPEGCGLLLGPSYALLRGQFAQKREKALAARARREWAERLFVSLGMTDPRNLTAAVLQGIAESGTGMVIDLVIGSAAPHLSDLRRQIKALDLDVRLHVDTDDVPALMAEADLAIGAAGSSSFERCCLGLPSLIVVAADNQRDIAATLLASGAAEEVRPPGLSKGIAEALRRLCADRQARAAMAEAAARLCDGRGAYRVADALSAPVHP